MTPCWCRSSCAAAERPQMELSYKCCTTGFWDSANLASPALTDLLQFLPVLVFFPLWFFASPTMEPDGGQGHI